MAHTNHWKRVALTGLGFLTALSLTLALTACVHTEPFLDAHGRVVPGSIALMQRVKIGGIPQLLWFRGLSTDNPALVLLHGGPGASENALFRHYNAELEKHFLVVYWDQRGAGRSFDPGIPPQSMNLEQFVRDLGEVVALVKGRFGKQKVVLLGHSWGTAFGLIYAHRHPEDVAAYVGVGQVADMPEGERASYEWALAQAQQRGDRKAVDELERIGPPPHDVDEMLVSRHWVERFGGSFHAGLSTGSLIWAALQTTEASWYDLILFGRGNRFSLEHLWPEFSRLRLVREYTSFRVPVFFLLGRYDWQVPSVVAADYFREIAAPEKHLIWFENSAHNVPFEEPEAFNRVLIEQVAGLAETGGWAVDRRVAPHGGRPRQ